jgi:hypothetical protein
MRRNQILLVLLLLLTAWLYRASLHFGYVWDDPLFFGRLLERPVMALLQPIPDFHFFRPGVMIYNRLFAGANGYFNALPHHAAQLGWHLLNIALLYALARRLGLRQSIASAAAILFALHPFSQQAVVWTQAQHPMATTLQLGTWAAYIHAVQRRKWQPLAASILLYLLALTVQESTVPMSLVPLLLLWTAAGRKNSPIIDMQSWRQNRWVWSAALYPLVAAVYTAFWLAMPRQSGVTVLGLEVRIVSYLLQAVIYPLLGRPVGYAADAAVSETAILVLAIGMLTVLVGVAVVRGYGRFALLAVAWAILGMLPALIGLPYSYINLAPRLAYVAAPGISLIWAVTLTGERRSLRLLGQLALLVIAVQSVWLILIQQEMWRSGTALQTAMISLSAEEPYPQLYVNYPDRYKLKRPFYPLGYWGVTLAPVVQTLGDFPRLVMGVQPQIEAVSVPWVGVTQRLAGPYEIDTRGLIYSSQTLYDAAAYGAVNLVQAGSDGTFVLQQAGRVMAGQDESHCLVIFDDKLCLEEKTYRQEAEQIVVTLVWRYLTAVDDDLTIFLHLGLPDTPPSAQADGDFWLGLLPLTIPGQGDRILEYRFLLADHVELGKESISVGVYSRKTGDRLPAWYSDGKRLPADAYMSD